MVPPKWRKLLYIKQDFPDNYVDDSFLEDLKKNVNVQSYDYWNIVIESGAICQHVSSIVVFISVFIYLYFEVLSPGVLITGGALLTAVGYAVWDIGIRGFSQTIVIKRYKIFKSGILFFTTLLGLSPILKTLTKDTSSDTIWALTVCLFIANSLLHDYSTHSPDQPIHELPGSIATNAAIFASVLLASRLPSNIHVFALISYAVAWFALFPIFRRFLSSLSWKHNISLTILLIALAIAAFVNISKPVVYMYALSMFFISFICPAWLIWSQRYKNQINGPWDEAQPKLHTD